MNIWALRIPKYNTLNVNDEFYDDASHQYETNCFPFLFLLRVNTFLILPIYLYFLNYLNLNLSFIFNIFSTKKELFSNENFSTYIDINSQNIHINTKCSIWILRKLTQIYQKKKKLYLSREKIYKLNTKLFFISYMFVFI